MRQILIFFTGSIIGLILSEVVGVFGYLLYDQVIGLKFVPLLFGILLVGLDFLISHKPKRQSFSQTYKSSFH
ncbi:MAG: hypothetical protein K0Q87_3677 [Neobacillus sp.]|jgi:putative Ca2+/H+ antiporter (TMEM165/GDT1 family)|nr:hypothetical protein [Neobacillus sp.]